MTRSESSAADTSHSPAVLHMVCGKIASGKSTLTQSLAQADHTIVMSEDAWMSHLYPGEIRSLDDYVRCSERVRDALTTHIQALLSTGLSVVLDFPFNTIGSRSWGRTLFSGAGVAHQLHYLDVSDDICKARLKIRNASGEHPFETTESQFDQITRYFVAPMPVEGFNVVVHHPD